MKKVLFFVESLHCGGAERSLLSLLNNLDYTGYDVHLMVAKRGGEFEKFVPKHLQIESIDVNLSLFSRLKFKALRFFDKKKKYHKAQLYWQSVKSDIPLAPGKYDIAISWGQGFATYFVAEKVTADKKLAWVNIDYKKAGYVWERDLPLYNKFYKVVGVSEFVKEAMQEFLPKEKVIAIRNIIDPDDILLRAKEPMSFAFDKDYTNIVSVGRLAKQKGFELAVEAVDYLVKKGLKVRWYIIGEGSERSYLEGLIASKNVQENLILLGFRDNPYPYIAASDIYAQTSWFEGLGRTIIEAGILCKPIVTTNFPTAHAILEHNKTGLIVDMDAAIIGKAVADIIENDQLRSKLVQNLQAQSDNEKQKTLEKVSQLFKS